MVICPSCATKQSETNTLCSDCGATLSHKTARHVAHEPSASPSDSGIQSSLFHSSHAEHRDSAANDETIVYELPQNQSTVAYRHNGNALTIAKGVPNLNREIESVLHRRLRGATLVLFMGHGAFSVFRFLVDVPDHPTPPFLNAFHVFIVVIFAVWGVILFRPDRIPLHRLRQLELIIFGGSAINFVLVDYVSIMECAPKGFVQNSASHWSILILLYGVFIPNTWRRAAAVVSGMFAISLTMTVFLKFRYEFVTQALSWVQVSYFAMQELVGCVGAITGAHLISTLRRQAFEAKQLGQYRLKELIGSGGMGEVYLGEHRLLKRPCAIKVIRPGKTADPIVLARFEREIQITAELSHPNTVEVYDHGRTEDGTFYYVMEYLPGLSLAQLVERHGPLPAARVVFLLKQTCSALREAHGAGLIHRDIKPENIFAAHRGGLYDVAKLLDFGLVKFRGDLSEQSLTQDGAIAGTPSYMSPEQSRGENEPDIRSDIYSMGAVAYFLLTGRPPFERDTVMQVLIAHARDDVVPPSRIRPDLPPDLEQVVLRCLAKNRDERFQDAMSLEEALSECQSNGIWTQREATRWWEESSQAPVELVLDETTGNGGNPTAAKQQRRR